MYGPLKFAGNISFDFITKSYEMLYHKKFPYPEYLTDETIFVLWDKLMGQNLEPLNIQEKVLYKFLKEAGRYIFTDPDMDIMKEWKDTLSMAAVCDRWKQNKQVLTVTDEFIECLSTASELAIPESITELLPFSTFCIDLQNNKYFPDIDYAYVSFRTSAIGSLEVHIERIINDEVFFTLYIIFDKETLYSKDGIHYYRYTKKDIPRQDYISVAEEAVNTIGKEQIDNSRFQEFCIFVTQLALYICTSNRDFKQSNETRKTYRPERKLQNKFAAIQKWDVGYVVGKTFQQKKEAATQKQTAGYSLDYKRKSPIPHMRKGHFQLYHVGAGRTEVAIRWIDPVFVNGNPKDNPLAIVHKVK